MPYLRIAEVLILIWRSDDASSSSALPTPDPDLMWLPVSGHHTMHASMRPSLALKFRAGQMSCFTSCEYPSELQAWQGFDGVKASRIALPFPSGLYQTVAVPRSQDPSAWGLYCGGAINPKYFSIALVENRLGIEQVSHLQAQNCDLSPPVRRTEPWTFSTIFILRGMPCLIS